MYNFNFTAGVTGNNKFPCAHVTCRRGWESGDRGSCPGTGCRAASKQHGSVVTSSTCRSLLGVAHRALRNRSSSLQLQHRQQKPCKAHVDALLSVVRRPPTCALSPQRKNFPSSSRVQIGAIGTHTCSCVLQLALVIAVLNHAGIYIMNHLLEVWISISRV